MTVSVVIPFYNRRELLIEAMNSVKHQSYKNWELILVDDGSNDGSLEAAQHWVNDNSCSVKIISLKHKGFPGRSRNRGVNVAEGDWLAFLDSDDLWEPGKLEQQIQYAKDHPDLRILHCREKWLRHAKVVSQRKQRHKREGDLFADSLKKCIIGPSTVMIRRDLWKDIQGFREDMEVAEDYELWLRICAKEKVGYLEKPLITKRAGEWDQLSEKYGQIEIFRIQGLKDLVESRWFALQADTTHQRMARKELAEKCRIYSLGCKKREKVEQAKKYWELFERYSHPSE